MKTNPIEASIRRNLTASYVTAVACYLVAQAFPDDRALKWSALLLLALHGVLWLFLEWARGLISQQVRWMLERPGRCALLLLGFTAVFTTYYLAPGWLFRGDGILRTSKVFLFKEAVRGGEWPVWSFQWYGGFPFLLFDPPVSYYWCGIFAVLTDDANLGSKIGLWLCHIASSATLFLFLQRLAKDRAAAVAGSLAYVLTFWHGASIVYLGQFQMAVFYVLLPLPFWILERLLDGEERWPRAALALGLACAVMLYTHLAYTFWVVMLVALWCLVRLAQKRDMDRLRRLLLTGIGTGVVMGILCAGFLVPFALEVEHTNSILAHVADNPQDVQVDEAGLPFLDLVRWTREWRGFGHGVYLGISLLLLAAAGAVAAAGRYRREALPAVVFFLFIAFVIWGRAVPGHDLIPTVNAMPPWRYLMFFIFALALLVGFAARFLFQLPWTRERVLLALVVLMMADLGKTTLIRTYLPEPLGPRQAAYDILAGARGRVLDLREPPNAPDTLWVAATPLLGLRTPFGGYPEDSTTLYAQQAAIAARAAGEIYDEGRWFSDRTLRGLALMDVEHVIVHGPTLQAAEGVPTKVVQGAENYAVIDLAPAGGGLRAGRHPVEMEPLEHPLKDVHYINTLFAEYALDTSRVDLVLAAEAAGEVEPVSATLVDGYHEGQTRLSFTYTLAERATVTIPYAWYPTLTLRLNGEVTPIERSPLGYLRFESPGGRHEAEVRAGISTARKASMGLSVLGLVLVLAGLLWLRPSRAQEISS